MKNDTIAPLTKNTINKTNSNNNNSTSGCCGGAPESNADACCKLDEVKKAEGASGCGCNTPEPAGKKTSCC